MKHKLLITDKISELFYQFDKEKIDLHNDYDCVKIEFLDNAICFSFVRVSNVEYKLISTVDALTLYFEGMRSFESNQPISTLYTGSMTLMNLDIGRYRIEDEYVISKDEYYYFSIDLDDDLSFSLEAKELWLEF